MSNQVDPADLYRILNNIDERLVLIEKKVQSGDSMPFSTQQHTDHPTRDVIHNGARDNAKNQTSEEEKRMIAALPTSSSRSQTANVTKSASFNESSHVKLNRDHRRYSYSIPSDKEESKRINRFRRECLTHAIRWNLVDILKSVPEGDQDYIIDRDLPEWLKDADKVHIRSGRTAKSRMRRFLLVLEDQSFDVMRSWLHEGKLEKTVQEMIWKTYEEFSDNYTNTTAVKCILCRLTALVPADAVIDYLYSADVISKATLRKVDGSSLPNGDGETTWKMIVRDCLNCSCPNRAIYALKIALSDLKQISDDIDKERLDTLIDELLNFDGDIDLLFKCQCSELCSKSMHPISVMKSMSLVQAYMSPTPKSEIPAPDLLSAEASGSSESSIFSTDVSPRETAESDRGSSDDQTSLKKVFVAEETVTCQRDYKRPNEALDENEKLRKRDKRLGQEPAIRGMDIVPNMLGVNSGERPKRGSSLKSRRRRQEQLSSPTSSTEIESAADSGNQRPQTHGKVCGRYTQQTSTRAYKNNPQIIYGKNVYISHI